MNESAYMCVKKGVNKVTLKTVNSQPTANAYIMHTKYLQFCPWDIKALFIVI